MAEKENEVKAAEPEKKPARKKRDWKLWKEFKAFMNRGNAMDLAIGVVIGGVFNAIVTALTNILLSICTWTVPGGLAGLVTVLPPVSAGQDPTNVDPSWQASYTGAEFLDKVNELTEAGANVTVFTSSYTQHGTSYYYNGAAIIDWGAFINAVITFVLVGLTLFVIVKVYNYLKAQKEKLAAEALERYYLAHPEERPVPPEPGKPEPTEKDLLKGILVELQKQNGGEAASAEKKA